MAKLIDKPYTYKELKSMRDRMEGEINRMFVSDNIEEISSMCMFVCDVVTTICYSRIKEIIESRNEVENE